MCTLSIGGRTRFTRMCWAMSWTLAWWLTRLGTLKGIKLKGLNGQKLVSFEKDIPTRKALDKILKDHGVSVEHVMEFDNIETVKRAVEIDSGVAIVPQETIRQEVSSQTLAAVKLED